MLLKFKIGFEHWMIMGGSHVTGISHFRCRREVVEGEAKFAVLSGVNKGAITVGNSFKPDAIYSDEEVINGDNVHCCTAVFLHHHDGQYEKFAIDSGAVFILNDDGKTIERLV